MHFIYSIIIHNSMWKYNKLLQSTAKCSTASFSLHPCIIHLRAHSDGNVVFCKFTGEQVNRGVKLGV